MKKIFPIIFLITMLLHTIPVRAEKISYLGLSLGYLGPNSGDGKTADFRLEYRPASKVFLENLHPWMGLEVTADRSLWAGGGLLYDLELSDRWHLIPSFGAGYYAKGSSDLDLDYPVQFRSQLELAYQFNNGHRAALALSHLSNAGLGDNNPGTEIIGLYWHIPLR